MIVKSQISEYEVMPMKNIFRLIAILITLVVCVPIAQAQRSKKADRVGILSGVSEVPQIFGGFRQRLHELGYVEGKNISFERRYAAGDVDRLPGFAAELVKEQVDVIVTAGTPATVATKKSTVAIPIVMLNVADPVGTGLVASLARPGGNITGLSSLAVDLSGKRLELLKEAFPKLNRVALVWNSEDRAMTLISKRVQSAAPALGLTIQPLGVRDPDDLGKALVKISQDLPDALFTIADRLTALHEKQLLDFAVKNKLPTMSEDEVFVTGGWLMAYGPDRPGMWGRAASYVDKILKGTKPADLPVEQPMKFEFIVNLKAAKQIGLTIPPTVLARADKVIK
jgi:putative ABC transport system substrate-binding protein